MKHYATPEAALGGKLLNLALAAFDYSCNLRGVFPASCTPEAVAAAVCKDKSVEYVRYVYVADAADDDVRTHVLSVASPLGLYSAPNGVPVLLAACGDMFLRQGIGLLPLGDADEHDELGVLAADRAIANARAPSGPH